MNLLLLVKKEVSYYVEIQVSLTLNVTVNSQKDHSSVVLHTHGSQT
jgi:hypothetical protein